MFTCLRVSVLAVSFALACSGGSSEPAQRSLALAPTEWSAPAGGTPKQFTATLTGSSDPIVWSIETAGTAAEVGTLSSTGQHAPPPSLALGRDVVVKATAGALVGRATVHVAAAVDGVTIRIPRSPARWMADTKAFQWFIYSSVPSLQGKGDPTLIWLPPASVRQQIPRASGDFQP